MNKIIIAIDGYSSCGKSTVAKALADVRGLSVEAIAEHTSTNFGRLFGVEV